MSGFFWVLVVLLGLAIVANWLADSGERDRYRRKGFGDGGGLDGFSYHSDNDASYGDSDDDDSGGGWFSGWSGSDDGGFFSGSDSGDFD